MMRKPLLAIFTFITIVAFAWPIGSVSAAQQPPVIATPTRWITITSPNGGEILSVGSVHRITWNASANIDKIYIGYKACSSCLSWIATNIPNTGYYDWNVFVGNTTNTQFKIQVIGYQTGVGAALDQSDANFTVNQLPTPTRTPTKTRTFTPSRTPTITKTPTKTSTSTITPTWTPTDLPTDTATVTPSETATSTPIDTATATPSGTPTLTPTPALLPPGNGSGLIGEYFDNEMDMDGAPLHSQLDPQVNFNWDDGSVAENVPVNFTARWTGQLEARSSEEYSFFVEADDIARVWIDGQLYLSDWDDPQDDLLFGPPISLVAGQKYDLQIDFRDTDGGASISFNWHTLSDSIEWEVVPMQQLYPSSEGLPATATSTPTQTSTNTPTETPTETSTSTPTETATITASPTFTITSTRTPSRTPTNTRTFTPTFTRTFTVTATSTVPTSTSTFTRTFTPTFTRTATRTASNTATSTPVPPSITPTHTVAPTAELIPPGNGSGLIGAYFDNEMDMDGAPLHSQLDPQVNFNWDDGSVAENVPVNFTARWTGQLEARSSEEYSFFVEADDIARVWIDGELYVSDWDDPQDDLLFGPPISLVAGQKYDLQIDFRDTDGGASISFNWHTLSDSIEWEVVPMQQLYPSAEDLPATATATLIGGTALPSKTATATFTPTFIISVFPSVTETAFPTSSETMTPTFTPTNTSTTTSTFTLTRTPTFTPTLTRTNTRTPTSSRTPSHTPSPSCSNLVVSSTTISGFDFNVGVMNNNGASVFLTAADITWPVHPGMRFDSARFNGITYDTTDSSISPVITTVPSIQLIGAGSVGVFRARFIGTVNMTGVFGVKLTFNFPGWGDCILTSTITNTTIPATPTFTRTYTPTRTPTVFPTFTETPEETATFVDMDTITPTVTLTPSMTPTRTRTPTPTLLCTDC